VDFALYGHAALLSRAQSLAARELTCEERVRYLSEARRCS